MIGKCIFQDEKKEKFLYNKITLKSSYLTECWKFKEKCINDKMTVLTVSRERMSPKCNLHVRNTRIKQDTVHNKKERVNILCCVLFERINIMLVESLLLIAIRSQGLTCHLAYDSISHTHTESKRKNKKRVSEESCLNDPGESLHKTTW